MHKPSKSHLGHRLNNMTHYMQGPSPTALCMSVCVCTHRYTVLHSRRKFKWYPRVSLEDNESRRAFVYRYILVCIHIAHINQEILFYSGLNRRSERTEEHTSETYLTHVVLYTCCQSLSLLHKARKSVSFPPSLFFPCSCPSSFNNDLTVSGPLSDISRKSCPTTSSSG